MMTTVILLLAAGLVMVALVLAKWLRAAANRGEGAVPAGVQPADEPGWRGSLGPFPLREDASLEGSAFDLEAHPRPTRGATDRRRPGAMMKAPVGPPRDELQAVARRGLDLETAAEALGVTPEALVAWETRYGYPRSRPSPTGEGGIYSPGEILELIGALQQGLSITSAIDHAQAASRRKRGAHKRPATPASARRDA